MKSTTILLVDDHHVVRQGLRILLMAEAEFEVVGEAADGREAITLTEKLKPDVLLLDLMMPGLNGLEVTRQLAKSVPQTRILVLSMHATEGYVLQALRNGASGFVLKDSPMDILLQGVREVAAGRRYLSPTLSERAIDAYVQKAEATTLDPYEMLTTREREVLQLASEGYSNNEIAERLFLSVRTVETHRAHLMRKLSLKTQTDLIRFAIRRGLLLLDT
jgi:DNA-binding NarL/FixJ family response regulator